MEEKKREKEAGERVKKGNESEKLLEKKSVVIS